MIVGLAWALYFGRRETLASRSSRRSSTWACVRRWFMRWHLHWAAADRKLKKVAEPSLANPDVLLVGTIEYLDPPDA